MSNGNKDTNWLMGIIAVLICGSVLAWVGWVYGAVENGSKINAIQSIQIAKLEECAKNVSIQLEKIDFKLDKILNKDH
jgi:hypothetical protein